MWLIVSDRVYYSVYGPSVCRSVTVVSPAKTAEPMPFWDVNSGELKEACIKPWFHVEIELF